MFKKLGKTVRKDCKKRLAFLKIEIYNNVLNCSCLAMVVRKRQ